MKKLLIILLGLQLWAIFTASPIDARPIWETPESATMRANLVFIPTRDVYRMSYSGFPASADSSRLNFWSSDNTYYSLDSSNVPSGVYYLTCNGRYILEVFSGGVKVAETGIKVTTKIVNPTCQSYGDQQERLDDLGLSDNGGQPNQDGKIPITWNPVPGASYYEIYKDGEKIGETPGTSWDIDGPGGYTVVGRDPNGEVVGESDYDPPDPFPGGGNTGGCDACKWLTDMLACPAWDDYMGELTDAIRNAMPPPPDWDSIADTFVGKFADYFGDVPPPPSRSEIDQAITPPLPPLDTSVPEASMVPQAPSEYNNGPLDFDITDGEEIEIIDESEPIEIYEPDKYINSDEPGEMVFPGDPRNHSDGIKEPDRVDTGVAMPQPSVQPDPGGEMPGGGQVQPTDMPMPGATNSPIPIPSGGGGIIPIPGQGGG